ncbi:MAG: hypothetical protein M1828_000418 [Chrysothrix sp. TS-e1954]|nr:MAG: hypothetical protein M1828_000418 [Chrysothrix sp. TS-e1954]
MSTPASSNDWRHAAAAAQKHRDDSIARIQPPLPDLPDDLPLDVTHIPKELLSATENDITTLSVEDLFTATVTQRKYTSVQVIGAYLRRAALAQKLVNCITELIPEQALERAQYLDSYLDQHGHPMGPLHGVPISVKEHIGMRGLSLNAAYCCLYEDRAEDDAEILKILYNAGIRSPAANNGVYGLRPTSCRLPLAGIALENEEEEQISGTVGPMSTSLSGIELFMKVALAAKPWLCDPSLVPLPWKQAKTTAPSSPTKIRIGVFEDDGVVRPHPPITFALNRTVDALRSMDEVEVVEWVPYKHNIAWEIISGLYYPDGGSHEIHAIERSGEPWLPLSNWILKDNPHVHKLDIPGLWSLLKRKTEYCTAHAREWNSTATRFDKSGAPLDAVDVLLCPVGPGAAPPLGCSKYWSYTSQWNLVDYPAVAFPLGSFEDFLGGSEDELVPRNPQDEYNARLYDPQTYAHAPVGLQLVGRRFEDAKLLGILRRLYPHIRKVIGSHQSDQ